MAVEINQQALKDIQEMIRRYTRILSVVETSVDKSACIHVIDALVATMSRIGCFRENESRENILKYEQLYAGR